ncbi:MAG: alpha/beta fold hydrolase [Burkholderiales bacterium]|nr:alpha/beta fold hydrolase [Burkholderiales bacterium]
MGGAVELAFVEGGEPVGEDGTAPLLVLHGLFGSGTNWRAVARALGRHRRVLLVDARNHGSSPHSSTMDYPAMAGDVRELMRRQGLARAALLGHSMGGKTAMTLALESPALVERLVVVDIAPTRSPGDHAPLLAAMAGLDLSRVQRRSDADALLADAVDSQGLRAFLLQNLVSDGKGFRWRLNLAAIEASLPALLDFPALPGHRFEGPALFVRGERSEYLRDAHRDALVNRFPAAELLTVPRAGHWIHSENMDGFLEAVEPFLA